MEYGQVLGATVGGAGGAAVAALPDTGGSLRIVTWVALFSIAVGLIVVASVVARTVALRYFSN